MALVAALAIATGGLAACGDDEEPAATAPPPAAAPATTTEDSGGAAAGAEQSVEVSADPGGKLEYEQSSLSAEAGSVTFEFDNPSSVPHDLNIEQDGTKLAGTAVITDSSENLTVDLEAGSYQFYCSVGGHRQAGMEGTLTVK